ncbi:vWA domain-containing protein [Archangium gephyra]|uniref:vWA domain-containing protein n=1 Tax=Archangium gephyra TaxID=48 RepID=UPI003B78467F
MSHLARLLLACLLLVSTPGTVLAQPEACCTTGTEEDDDFPYEQPFHPCREDGRGQETEHRVEARIHGELAHLTVHRTFHNANPRYTELYDWLELPLDGTVHGFALESGGQWTEGPLLAASEAERRYEALRSPGTAAPGTSARLSAAGDGAALHLWNLPPGASVKVRYDVRIRLGYAGGRGTFTYPLPERESHPHETCREQDPRPVLTVAPPFPGADVLVQEVSGQLQRKVLEASWPVKPFTGIDARAGLLPGSTGAPAFVQLRVGRLAEAPSRARVVFVVDASHSVGPDGIAQQLTFAGEYLQLLPDSAAEVVVFRRSAERLFGRLIPASEWKTALASVPAARLAPGNGSHLDEGLKLAQQVLLEGSGPVRLIAFSDGLLRRTFEPLPASPTTSAPDAAVHLRWLYTRVDKAPRHPRLSEPLIQQSCGLQLPPYRSSVESLVRPMAWEQVRLEDERGTRLMERAELLEGQGVQRWLPGLQTSPGRLVLRGQRWGCPVSLPVELDAAITADLGRNAHGWHATRYGILSAEQRPPAPEAVELLAKNGDWLSPTRSFLASPPGAGPSSVQTYALPEQRQGEPLGMGVLSGSLCGPVPREAREDAPRFSKALKRLLRPAVAACVGGGRQPALQVRLETTGDEIADVEVRGATSETQATCVREATWALRLPTLFDDGFAETYTLTPLP